MRILITGASGFVGRRLVPFLKKSIPDIEIMACGGPEDHFGFDICDYEAVSKIIKNNSPDFIIHLAALSSVSVSLSSSETTYAVNLGGTLNILKAIEQEAPSSILIFASSSEVYGRSFLSGSPIAEDDLLAPANPYAVSKAAADLATQEAAHRGIKAIILRLFNHTGPGQLDTFALPSFAKQIARIESGHQPAILRTGNLSAMRDFLDVRDVLNAYTRAIQKSHELGGCEIFNICTGAPKSLQSLVDHLLSLSSTRIRVETDPARIRPVDIKITAGDASRARKKLQWEPRYTIRDTLFSLLEHERTQLKKQSNK